MFCFPLVPSVAPSGGAGSAGAGAGTDGASLTLAGDITGPQTTGTDCGNAGGVTDLGYNLDSDGSCDLTGLTDISGSDPDLGPLANNGGPTPTMLPLAGSPATSTIPMSTIVGSTQLCPRNDQRGYASPAGAACTMGAVEPDGVAPTHPTVTSVSPDAGPTAGGTSVTVTGSGFTGTSQVWFGYGYVLAASFTVDSPTQITAVSPAQAAGTVGVRIVTPGGTSNPGSSDLFSYYSAPTISAVSPVIGAVGGGTSVTITGTNLVGATAVHFGSTSATSFTVTSATTVRAVAPGGTPGSVDVTVTTPGGTSATSPADQFSYQNAPTVTAISPGAGPTAGGTSVTITGTGFTNVAGVYFGGVAATSFTVDSSTKITAVSPAHSAGSAGVRVIAGGTSDPVPADVFVYNAAPTISAVSPAAGAVGGGTSVTITGTNLVGATAVHFGSTSATSFTVTSATTVRAVAPGGTPGSVDVTVTTPGGTSATSPADQFSYQNAPTVTAISPGAGPTAGGTSVTITGTGFTNVAGVYFGGVAATSFTVDSSTKITAVSPAHSAGSAGVRVIAGGTSDPVPADVFVYR
jgi:hypothetical protein